MDHRQERGKMSSGTDDIVAQARMLCCASCGKSEVDDIKLVPCDACDLVRYCSDECQANHRLEHEAKCKERAVELRDEILFRQPECTHLGDCPILQVMAFIFQHLPRQKNCCPAMQMPVVLCLYSSSATGNLPILNHNIPSL